MLLDEQYLETVRSFEVEARIRAVGEALGQVVGLTESGDLLYAWDLDGRELRRQPNLTGTVYEDLAVVRDNLVCSGTAESGALAVLDVVEPRSLTRVARHRCFTRVEPGKWLTAGGFDYVDERFIFLPSGGSRPNLLAYAPDGVSLDEWVAATLP